MRDLIMIWLHEWLSKTLRISYNFTIEFWRVELPKSSIAWNIVFKCHGLKVCCEWEFEILNLTHCFCASFKGRIIPAREGSLWRDGGRHNGTIATYVENKPYKYYFLPVWFLKAGRWRHVFYSFFSPWFSMIKVRFSLSKFIFLSVESGILIMYYWGRVFD